MTKLLATLLTTDPHLDSVSDMRDNGINGKQSSHELTIDSIEGIDRLIGGQSLLRLC